VQAAIARAQVALHAPVVEHVPPAAWIFALRAHMVMSNG